MTAAHEKCFKALRSLRFNWIQDAEVALDKKNWRLLVSNQNNWKQIRNYLQFFTKSCISVWKESTARCQPLWHQPTSNGN